MIHRPAQGSLRCSRSSTTHSVTSPDLTCSKARRICTATATLTQTAPNSQQLALNAPSNMYSQPRDSAATAPSSIASSQLLAAVAGAAAVAAAGADLQTAVLPNRLLQDSNTVTVTAQALLYDSDNANCSSCDIPQLSPKQSRHLTSHITNSNSWQELLQLHSTFGQQMNIIHVSAVMLKLGKLLRDAAVVPVAAEEVQLLQQFLQKLEQSCILLMAHVQLQQPGVMQVLRSVGHRLYVQEITPAANGPQQLPVQPQQLSTIAWGFASAGYQPSRRWWTTYFTTSTPLLPSYTPHEISTAIWASAKLHQHPPTTWMTGYLSATAEVLKSGRVGFSPQEMCMMLWGLAVLDVCVDSGWWACLQTAVEGQLQRMKPRDLAQVLWAHARLSALPPKPWLSQVLAAAAAAAGTPTAAAAARYISSYSGRDVAMLLWALATLQRRQQQQEAVDYASQQQLHSMGQPPQQQQQQLVEALLRSVQMSHRKLTACGPQDFAHILWSLAVLSQCSSQQQQQHQPEDHVQQQHTLQPARICTNSSHGDAFNVLDRSNVCTSDSNNPMQSDRRGPSSSSSTRHECRQQASGVVSSSSSSNSPLLQSWINLTWRYTQPATSNLGPVDAAQLLWAASQLDTAHWPDPAWMHQFWTVGRHKIERYNTQALTVAMWAAYKMGHKPPRSWLVAVTPVLQIQLADLQPAAACQLLYVLASVQHRPNPGFMQQLLSRLQLDSHQLQPRAFACVLWSLGRLGYHPGYTWWAVILHHLSGIASSLGQRELQNVVWGLLELSVELPGGLLMQLQQRMLQLQQQA